MRCCPSASTWPRRTRRSPRPTQSLPPIPRNHVDLLGIAGNGEEIKPTFDGNGPAENVGWKENVSLTPLGFLPVEKLNNMVLKIYKILYICISK